MFRRKCQPWGFCLVCRLERSGISKHRCLEFLWSAPTKGWQWQHTGRCRTEKFHDKSSLVWLLASILRFNHFIPTPGLSVTAKVKEKMLIQFLTLLLFQQRILTRHRYLSNSEDKHTFGGNFKMSNTKIQTDFFFFFSFLLTWQKLNHSSPISTQITGSLDGKRNFWWESWFLFQSGGSRTLLPGKSSYNLGKLQLSTSLSFSWGNLRWFISWSVRPSGLRWIKGVRGRGGDEALMRSSVLLCPWGCPDSTE